MSFPPIEVVPYGQGRPNQIEALARVSDNGGRTLTYYDRVTGRWGDFEEIELTVRMRLHQTAILIENPDTTSMDKKLEEINKSHDDRVLENIMDCFARAAEEKKSK